MKDIYVKKDELGEIIGKYYKQDLISVENLLELIEELDYEINRLNEKIEDMEQDIKENYKPIPLSEQYGVDSEFD